MLHASLQGSSSGLGFSLDDLNPVNWIKSAGNLIEDGAKAAGHYIAEGAKYAGEGICAVVDSGAGQVAANASLQYGVGSGNPYAIGTGIGAKLANSICQYAGQGGSGGPAALPSFPPGSIEAFDDTVNLYRIAIPIGTVLKGLGEVDFTGDDAFVAKPYNLMTAGPLAYRIMHADSPYRSVMSEGQLGGTSNLGAPAATHREISATPIAIPGPIQVSFTNYQIATGTLPWYKDTTTLLLIGGGVVGLLLLYKQMA